MDRLFKKGLLDRTLEGRAFRYSPRYSREEFERVISLNGLGQLLHSERASLHLSYLVEAVGAQGEALLDELQALIEKRKAELRKGE
jgi:predicted transcriptional regulator